MMISSKTKQSLSSSDQQLIERCEIDSPIGCCSIGVPRQFLQSEFASDFLFWFPQGVPPGSSVTIASSRMPQSLDKHPEWFDALRTLSVQISEDGKFILTSARTTTDQFLKRVAQLFPIELVEFLPFPKKPTAKWFSDQAIHPNENQAETRKCFFKPLEPAASQEKVNIDELLIQIAETTVLLSARKNGNVFRAALNRLSLKQKPSTRLLIKHNLTPPSVESELRANGAIAWWLYEPNSNSAEAETDDNNSTADQKFSNRTEGIILSVDEIKTDIYLAHWTRRRVGPWPDQSSLEFLDDLIFQDSRREHSELSALCRILASRKILGSNELTRCNRNVVCFSDLPLDEILEHRVFRPHLSRWDFEPYGIAIERDYLSELGAKPVIYGEEAEWAGLPESEQEFFQLRTSKNSKIDWSAEREWRLIGNLSLKQIPADRALVFVKTLSDAQFLAELSRWPIVVLGNMFE